MNVFSTNDELVDHLRSRDFITTDAVEQAFRNVDRQWFVPDEHSDQAYADRPLPLETGATISAPHMVAVNTELLNSTQGNTVLEIGSGSGYQLAVLAELTDSTVTGVERLEPLVEQSRTALQPWENVHVVHGNGLDAVDGTFDRILYSCAINTLDPAIEHLNDDGRIVAPITQNGGQVLTTYQNGETETHGNVRFVEYVDE